MAPETALKTGQIINIIQKTTFSRRLAFFIWGFRYLGAIGQSPSWHLCKGLRGDWDIWDSWDSWDSGDDCPPADGMGFITEAALPAKRNAIPSIPFIP